MTADPSAAPPADAAHIPPKAPALSVWRQRLILIEAGLGLATAVLSVKLIPFRRLAAWSSRPLPSGKAMPPVTEEPDSLKADPDFRTAWQIGRLVAIAARKVPFAAVCLPQALVGQGMLRRRGVPTEIVYGVKRQTPGGGIEAHAWLEYRGQGFLGHEVAPAHTEIARFPEGAGGRRRGQTGRADRPGAM
ncbi:lasso peptide biosynthesis B2 protein (plasmid) [Tistrella bauzanensis]|nr:lasso peptide biosynthesis B2 protein [Tistrella bauzanensis]